MTMSVTSGFQLSFLIRSLSFASWDDSAARSSAGTGTPGGGTVRTSAISGNAAARGITSMRILGMEGNDIVERAGVRCKPHSGRTLIRLGLFPEPKRTPAPAPPHIVRAPVCGLDDETLDSPGPLSACGAAHAQNWPSFRGADANGVLESLRGAALSWDADSGRHVASRTPIPGLGHSSPIVWGDRIVVTTAISSDSKSVFQYQLASDLDQRTDVAKHQFKIYCLARRTGRIVWEEVAAEMAPRAAPSAQQLSLGDARNRREARGRIPRLRGLYAFDLDGKLLW